MFDRFYENAADEICEKFVEAVSRLEQKLTPAELQKHLIIHKDNPENAIEHASEISFKQEHVEKPEIIEKVEKIEKMEETSIVGESNMLEEEPKKIEKMEDTLIVDEPQKLKEA